MDTTTLVPTVAHPSPSSSPGRNRRGEVRKFHRRTFGASSAAQKRARKAKIEAAKKKREVNAAMASSSDSPAVVPSTEHESTTAGDASNSAMAQAEAGAGDASGVSKEEFKAMDELLTYLYNYETADGHQPSKLFQRMVQKRFIPDYFEIIKEPVAMSTIKSKINTRKYSKFEEFVRDFAQISHNAQVYNRPDAQAYQDALLLKEELIIQLAKLVDRGLVTAERVELPYLGELPPPDEISLEDVEDEEDEDEEEDEEDDEDSEDEGKKKKKRGRKSLADKRDSKADGKDKEDDPEARKKRGRPPRVDTPMEARIKAVIKGLRKPKNAKGELMIGHFERMPDKAAMPEYFNEIKQPMAFDLIKKKLKRKKYTSVEQFMRDVELVFENAKQYNTDESQIYKDAVEMQIEARSLADAEKSKPDTEYGMEDGRIPLPDGILHNGEQWKVGDWIHIANANDLTKPIVAQIYRTWQDQDGGKWVNACWYYRPEQTVHRFDRHFYENEVVKTGQYRDHPIDEVVDRCFVMFFTRYNKGRPRNFPPDKEIYVCEARYNEEKHKLNKIKTWASCLPDEVRDKDYEMDLFDAPRRLRKVPSPIKYLFKEDEQKETDDMPKPIWGAPNAPPKIGAVHCLPRDPKDSPPPMPTPTPPPQPVPAPRRQIQAMSTHPPNGFTPDRPANININAANMHHPAQVAPTPPQALQTPLSYNPSHAPQYHQTSASPAPAHQHAPHSNSYAVAAPQGFAPQIAPAAHNQYGSPHHTQQGLRGPQQAPPPGYKAPNPVNVWHLPDAANASIPADIRNQFQQDAHGRVLFFTEPPVASRDSKTSPLKHTPTYLQWKAKDLKEKQLLKMARLEEEGKLPADSVKMLDKRRAEIESLKRRRAENASLPAADAKKRRAEESASAPPKPKQGPIIVKLDGSILWRPDGKPMRHPTHPDGTLLNTNELNEMAANHLSQRLMDSTIHLYESTYPPEERVAAFERDMARLEAIQQAHRLAEESLRKQQEEKAKKEWDDNAIFRLPSYIMYKPPNEHLEWGPRPEQKE